MAIETARKTLCRFKTPDAFLVAFNPDHQVRYTKDQRKAYLGEAPSLSIISACYGEGISEAWLIAQLWNLAEFSGCKEKISEAQIEEVSMLIREEYHYLKVTELMDFFRRFKLGEYGKFYGSVDPLVITTALKEFLQQRRQILYALDQEDREMGKREDASRIRFKRDYEAVCKMRKFYSYNFRSTDFTLEDFKEIYWLFKLGYERSDHGYDEG